MKIDPSIPDDVEVFHSLSELNHGISQQLEKLNDKRYKGSAYSRRQLFEVREKSLLKVS